MPATVRGESEQCQLAGVSRVIEKMVDIIKSYVIKHTSLTNHDNYGYSGRLKDISTMIA